MPSEKLTFTGHTGAGLAALFDRPSGPILATAIFAHCFTCSKDILAAKRISQRLPQRASPFYGLISRAWAGLVASLLIPISPQM